jgi:hypothetical protein
VARLRLLPGERELVRLRPSVGAFLPRLMGPVSLALWGLAVAYAPGFDALLGKANGLPFLLVAAAVPTLGGAALYAPKRRLLRLVLCLAAATAVMAAPFLPWGLGDRLACAVALWTAAAVAAVLAETDRRLRTYHLTNLRILHRGGLWDRAPWTLHYDAVLDLDSRQGPLGRLLGHGTLVPVLQEPGPAAIAKPTKRRKAAVPAMATPDLPPVPPRLWGVRPFVAVRELVEAFIQDATATAFLRADQQTQKRVGRAIRAVGRANLLA